MGLNARLGQLDTARELVGFQTEPAQMRAAAPGKVGELRLGFSLREGRSILHDLYRVTPLLVQQALYWDEAMPELPICSIIAIGGGILQGDRYRIDISVGEGACAHVTTQSANRVHQMDANYASQHQAVTLESGAYLEYLPDFTIPYRGSRFINQTDIVVAEDATLLHGEMVLAGRKHHHVDERFGLDLLSLAVAVRRPDGRKIFAEKILIEKDEPTVDYPAVMGGLRRLRQHYVPHPAARGDPHQGTVRDPFSRRGAARHFRCLSPAQRGRDHAACGGHGDL